MDYCRLAVEQQASGRGSEPTGPSGFLFVGGHISIDFINTEMIESGQEVDRVASPQALAAWVAASSLGPEFGVPTDIESTIYTQAIRLREALSASYNALIDEQPVPEPALKSLNAALSSAPGTELRRLSTQTLSHLPRVDLAKDASHLPWLLANAAAQLLCSNETKLLRRCANRDHCMLVFLDTSRSRTRRWCSMDLCGNRRKVAAHNQRTRQRRSKDVP
jgi:predicted RNA-binding Zn ribbon-like protein